MKTQAPIRWGIIATGFIAAKFATACNFEAKRTGRSILSAVASRNAKKSAAFAAEYHIPHSYGSYEELIHDPNIDAIYVATPHTFHAELSITALSAGKSVLCEKPAGLNAMEFHPVVETARHEKRFYMEAMWMKFNPSFRKALTWVQEGRIGKIQYLNGAFFFAAPFNPEGRLFNPSLGGGALLDVGIYPATFATMFAGRTQPDHISSIIKKGSTEVDIYNQAHLVWNSGIMADIASSISLQSLDDIHPAIITGETGTILIPAFWRAQQAILLDTEGHKIEHFNAPFECNGYEYELREVEECLLSGKTESPVHTYADSAMVLKILDTIRMAAQNE